MPTPQVAPFPKSPDPQTPFSSVDDEPPLRWQRAVHLAPRSGLGVGRRALFFALLTWLPIAIWALARGRFLHATPGEPLLEHYGVHVRCLVAIPLLIIGEATLHTVEQLLFPRFLSSGVVSDATRPAFDQILHKIRRQHEATAAWLFLLAAALALTLTDRPTSHIDEMSWAVDATGVLGFGGVWFAYVVRPLFLGLFFGWLLRLALTFLLFVRIARLDLSLVPAHPDRTGGIGFVEMLPLAFAPVSLALSAMLASRWAHEIVYHHQTIYSFKFPALMFVVVWSLLLLAPLVPLIPSLVRAKRAAMPSYSANVAEQARAIRRRWIERTSKSDEDLEYEGIGVTADAATMYHQVQDMRVIPFGRPMLVAVLLPLVVPMLVLVALQIPIKTLLVGLAKTLM